MKTKDETTLIETVNKGRINKRNKVTLYYSRGDKYFFRTSNGKKKVVLTGRLKDMKSPFSILKRGYSMIWPYFNI